MYSFSVVITHFQHSRGFFLFFATVLFFAPALTFAYFAPGETLNPDCSPGDSECDIENTTLTLASSSVPVDTDEKLYNLDGTLYWNGSEVGGGSGLTSLNGLTGSTQTFANDTNVTIVSSGSTHTLTWSGQLAVARGGTGATTLTGVLIGNGTSAFTATTTLSAAYVEDAYVRNTGDSISGSLTFSGSTANIALGSNYLSGDGDDEGVFVDSSGRVGIGTTSPESLLNIIGSSTVFTIGDTRDIAWTSGDQLSAINFTSRDSSSSLLNASRATIAVVQESTFGSQTGLAFSTRNINDYAERVRITNDGKLGVGTTSPSATFAVQGTGYFTGSLIAPSTGLTFLQGVSGATTRNVSDKLAETVSVKDFGAVGNGSTDDTTAVQNAINSASTTNRTIYFPKGTYLISGVRLPDTYCANLRGDGMDVTYITVGSATTSAILKTNDALSYGCSIKDLTVDANNNASYGLELQRGKQWDIQNVKVVDSTSDAVRLGDGGSGAIWYEAKVRDLVIEYQSGNFTAGEQPDYGLHTRGTATDSTYDSIVVKNAKTAGIRNEGGNNIFIAVHLYGYPLEFSPLYGLHDTGADNRYIGFYTDYVTTAGVFLNGSRTIMTGAQFYWGDTTTYPTAGIAKIGTSATESSITASSCHNMNSSSTPITYDAGSPTGALVSFQVSGCSNTQLSNVTIYGGNQEFRLGYSDLYSWKQQRNTTSGDLEFSVTSATSTYSTRVTFGANGRVGIGTTTPNTQFTVTGSGTHGINLDVDQSTATNSGRLFFTNSTGSFALLKSSDNLNFNYGATPGSSNGTTGMVMTSAGYIGIGTSSPESLLNIIGSSTVFTIGDTRDQNWTVGEQLSAINFTSRDSSSSHANASRAKIAVIQEATFGSVTGLAFSTRNINDYAERVRITNDGKFAIGTTSPLAKLDLYGTAGSSDLFAISSSTNVRLLTLTAAGRIGLGTSTPLTGLDILPIVSAAPNAITSIANGSLLIGASDTSNRITSGVVSGSMAYGWFQTRFQGVNAGVTNLALNPIGGLVGIGTTTPLAKLDIIGTAGSADIFAISSSTNIRLLTFSAAGRLGIGTTTPEQLLSVAGTVGFRGLTAAVGAGSLCLSNTHEVVYNSGSDNCLSSTRITKNHINELSLLSVAEDMLTELTPVSFIYNNDQENRVRYGFIADDATLVDPHLGTYNDEGKLTGLDTNGFLALIVSAVKDIYGKLDSLKDKFTTKELCLEDICIDRDELYILLNNSTEIAGDPEPVQEEEENNDEPNDVVDTADDAVNIVTEENYIEESDDDNTDPITQAEDDVDDVAPVYTDAETNDDPEDAVNDTEAQP